MSFVRTAVGIGVGALLLLVVLPTASAQETDWQLVDRMSDEQALQTYQDCGLRKLDQNLFVENYPRLRTRQAPQSTGATIQVNYSAGFPADAQEAFQRAVDIWEMHITSPVTIRMDARWESLGGNTLGAAGPRLGLVDTNNDGDADTIIGFPLLDALTGADQSPEFTDIIARFNSSRTDWHFGEGPAPAGTIDFTSVVLHEIAHGLNYVDLFNYDGGTGGYGLDFDNDGQIDGNERSAGPFGRSLALESTTGGSFSALTNESQFPNPSEALGDALTSDRLYFNGTNARRGAQIGSGPVPPKMYAPPVFQGGSSIAHLSEFTYPAETPNALMTPQIGQAETNRTPGAIVCGQMQDMGWTLATGCQQYFRDVFALQVERPEVADGSVNLSWNVGESANIEEYLVDARYFDGEFQTLRQIDASSLDTPTVTLDSLGLGVFTFRLRWVRSDGTEGTTLETVQDTINVGDVTAEVASRGEQGRGTITFSWTEPPGTAPGVSYQVERRTAREGTYAPVTTTMQTSYTAERQTPGRYQYRVRSTDGQGNSIVSTTEDVQVDFEGDVYTLGPYPNPVRETATLELTARESQSVTVEVFTTLGQRLYSQERNVGGQTPTRLSIDVSEWGSGTYFVRVQGDTGFTETQQLLVVQ